MRLVYYSINHSLSLIFFFLASYNAKILMKLHDCYDIYTHMDFPGGSVVRNPRAKQETWVQPGSGRSLGEGNGNPLRYSCVRNPMDRRSYSL